MHHQVPRSDQLFQQSAKLIPGGVNSPVRAFKVVGGTPVFIDRAQDCYLYDVDGNQYIDYVMSWGAMVAGHANSAVLSAVEDVMRKGLSFGAPTELELVMAQTLCGLVPNMQQVRMVNSGTEATMSALRLARGVTGRNLIVKFEGCYHGHNDSLLVKTGSGALTLGVPTSPGVSEATAAQTVTLSYNDIEGCKQFFQQQGSEVAAVIVEPVAGNMNCVPPIDGFLQTLRSLCDEYQSILIFDEVMSGFRVALSGAQSVYGVDADLITLGKVIGGGLPVGAYGGKLELMQHIAPTGPIYQAGTLSGNPMTMAAGIANLTLLQQENVYSTMTQLGERLLAGIEQVANEKGIALTTNQVGSMIGLFFTEDEKVTHYQQVINCNNQQFNQFFHGMLKQGVYLAPASYEAGFLSIAHTEAVIDQTIHCAAQVFSDF